MCSNVRVLQLLAAIRLSVWGNERDKYGGGRRRTRFTFNEDTFIKSIQIKNYFEFNFA